LAFLLSSSSPAGEIPHASNPVSAKQHNPQKPLETASKNCSKSYSVKEEEMKIPNAL